MECGSPAPALLLLGRVPLDKNEGVAEREFFGGGEQAAQPRRLRVPHPLALSAANVAVFRVRVLTLSASIPQSRTESMRINPSPLAERKAALRPLLRVIHQLSCHRVRMHVLQLSFFLCELPPFSAHGIIRRLSSLSLPLQAQCLQRVGLAQAFDTAHGAGQLPGPGGVTLGGTRIPTSLPPGECYEAAGT